MTDIAFASPSKLVAETVVTEVNKPVNALMMLDLLWQLTDIWRDNTTTDVQKLTSSGGIVAMLVVPHLYLVPMVYHASLQGDPKQLAYVMACYICPPAMLPMLVESMGGRIIAGAKQALFQKELEAMFQASSFKPEPGTEPKEWAQNRDAIRYTWIALNTELDYLRPRGRAEPRRVHPHPLLRHALGDPAFAAEEDVGAPGDLSARRRGQDVPRHDRGR